MASAKLSTAIIPGVDKGHAEMGEGLGVKGHAEIGEGLGGTAHNEPSERVKYTQQNCTQFSRMLQAEGRRSHREEKS